jgi:hypothetical protein
MFVKNPTVVSSLDNERQSSSHENVVERCFGICFILLNNQELLIAKFLNIWTWMTDFHFEQHADALLST